MIDKEILYDAVFCKEDDSVLEVSRIIRDTKSRHLIVVDKNLKPLGIISAFDINNRVVAQEIDPKKITAVKIMTKPVEAVDISSNYKDAVEKMAALETYTLPVIENGKLIGTLDYSAVFRKICEVKQ